MDQTFKFEINKCNFVKCRGIKGSDDRDSKKTDSAPRGITYRNGYKGKICDIWHQKVDEKLFIDWLKESKKNRSLLLGRDKYVKIVKPYIVAHSCVVELIFKMCKDLKQPADTRYRTVELFDRFIANQFVEILKMVKKKQDQISEWSTMLPRVNNQAVLRVISCIQLASKYCAQSTMILPKTAHTYLKKRGQSYSVQNVIASEIRVFKTLNFQIGVPTLLVFVDVLLPLIREYIHDKIYTVCIGILDIIYLQRHQIFKNLSDNIIAKYYTAHSKNFSFSSFEFDGLYCGAASIVSAIRIYYPDNKTLIAGINEKLANYIDRPVSDVLILSSIILDVIGL